MKTAIALLVALGAISASPAQAPLEREFRQPPASARPWVYWFWLNGNITRPGIKADLEAMHRAGIGGVLIMETDQGTPVGPIPFAGTRWRALFKYMLGEAHRLGIEVNMNDDAGWAGSGGPWVKPEVSMQKAVASFTDVEGPQHFVGRLAQPETVAGFYRDVAVLAYPAVGPYRIPDIEGKSGLVRQDFAPETSYGTAPADSVIDPRRIHTITASMDAQGDLTWDVPPGRWTIMRVGHTSTGSVCAPAPKSGTGLECDKLSTAGADAAFSGFIGKLVADNRSLVGNTFVRTHIDSWEGHSQDWTERFPAEFKHRRGYDLTRYLPVFFGRVVGNLEVSERFLWDVRQTIADLLLDNYAGHMEKLARRAGLGLSIEAYGDMCMDDLAYAGRADEPMNEFWTWPGGALNSPEGRSEPFIFEMSSAAHIYGKPILGAESFTSSDFERWQYAPGDLKGLGDWEFSRGVSRFVFHRYAMQPWLQVRPGMSMGPWGLHYERTETWWDESVPWHTYLARCQYLLRQGKPVIDVLYLAPEGEPSAFIPPPAARTGPYRADGCPRDALLHLASVKHGRIVFPSGMSYAALVLPDAPMTLEMLRKVEALADAGATIVGPKPVASPSLTGYPGVDAKLRALADRLWGSGKVVSKRTVEQELHAKGIVPDFQAEGGLTAMHRVAGNTDLYFVSNSAKGVVNSVCRFRVTGRRPELWNGETGEIRPCGYYTQSRATTDIPLSLGSHDSVFVVFRPGGGIRNPVVRLEHAHASVFKVAERPHVGVLSADWGPAGDSTRTKDVASQVQRLLDAGATELHVADLASEGDPALNVVKTLHLRYRINGLTYDVKATDPDTIQFELPQTPAPVAEIVATGNTRLDLVASEPGVYSVRTASGRTLRATVVTAPTVRMTGGWDVRFADGGGAPRAARFPALTSWSSSSIPGIRYFSGTATYRKSFDLDRVSGREILDLGQVAVIARVKVNGHDVGILWRKPYRADVTKLLHKGRNTLEIAVTNLWPNRMIGDELLPEDSDRNANGTLRQWPDWVLKGKTSPTGRFTFTSWRLWHKDDSLLPSGLLGPVVIRSEAVVRLR